MRVVATFHQPSSVSHSVKCNLTPDQEHLVVAKSNRLEVFSLQPEGLRRECGLDIWGRVVALRAVPVDDTNKSNLLVLTDHPDPKLIPLAYEVDESGTASLISKEGIDLHDRDARPAEFVTDVFVDPSGHVAIVSCYTGRLKLVQLENGEVTGIPTDISIPELYILSLTFLYTGADMYTIGILHYDHQQRLQLLSRDLDIQNKELSAAYSTLLPSTILSAKKFPTTETPPRLVSVPPCSSSEEMGGNAGVLVLGGRDILFFEYASSERQEIKKNKQRRASKRMSSSDQKEALKAKEKEKEREARKVKPRAGVKWPWSEVTACCPVDEGGRRHLIGDEYGRLAVLVFDQASSLVLVPLGEASPATTLTYLTSQVVYVGSHFGESQIIRVHPSPVSELNSVTLPIPAGIVTVSPSSLMSGKGKERADDDVSSGKEDKEGKIVSGKGSYVEVLSNHENIAPVMDAVLADIDGSGQPQIITCSGGKNAGALKVVQTGADFQEKAVVEGIPNITNAWPLRSTFEDVIDTHLVASTLEQTFAFSLNASDVLLPSDASANGFISGSATLAIKNVLRRVMTNTAGRTVSSYSNSSLVVQVTPERVRLLEYDAARDVFSTAANDWDPTRERRTIVAVDLNASQFVVGLSGGKLALLNFNEKQEFQVHKHRDFTDTAGGATEISAVSCSPFDSSKSYAMTIAVSFWGTNKVALLSLKSADSPLATMCECDALPSLPRALLLHNFGAGRTRKETEYHPHLLVGLTDGTLCSFSIKDDQLHDKKVFALGSSPVSFTSCVVDGKPAIFASGSRASVLHWDRQRLHQSQVMVKGTVCATRLNASAFPSSLVLCTPSSLVIGKIRGADKMQIKTVPLGLDNPRRISYHSGLKVVVVACVRTAPSRIGDFDGRTSSLKVLEDTGFNQLTSFTCEPGEEISSVLALPGGHDLLSPSFCIGTVRLQPGEPEPSHGRILLFSLVTGRLSTKPVQSALDLVVSMPVNGCIYQLVNVQDMVAAAVNSSVLLFRLERSEASSFQLKKIAEWNHNYIVMSLAAKGNKLIVGDAISSVSVLTVIDSQINTVARDYAPLWPVAVEAMGDNGVIGANSDCNLFTFSLQRSGNRATLERNGSFYLGDVVNKIIPGGFGSADALGAQVVEPRHIFFTSTGRIGVILEMSNEISLHMTTLQHNMAKEIVGPGGVSHTKYRAPANSKGHSEAESAFGFLDGDFLEQFLLLSNPSTYLQGEIEVERVKMSQAEVEDILEKLQSLH
ncbi:uncharacterized protein LAESUDRAFT_746751 [Laetiporus sulphureus 93-53]|uniref:DNA damage-binding protein 1 n=1 Tax=Laetiporus sulphureus 93-53 TaxID=1314785 RepID=A0A165HNK6_9APHY|nr:uncharacterized protein LAESUDRAFT_746751 [Laetiporus sulphureus 93-53]KZT11975.1 hypothetical protein LAESUDRAFT_746751 [Laetiporus sulphureus 93-53]